MTSPPPEEKPSSSPPNEPTIPLPPQTNIKIPAPPPPPPHTTNPRTNPQTLATILPLLFSLFSAVTLLLILRDGRLRLKPGEGFWFREGVSWWGLRVHLACVLPAGILLPLQFLPVMRQKFMGLHRWGGRLLFVQLLVGNITALVIARHSFGGTIDTQCATICLATITTFSLFKAWASIRSLHIDQHRVWALRTWSYACSILSLRIFMFIIAVSADKISLGGYRSTTTCEELISLYRTEPNATSVSSLYARYPACAGYEEATMGDVHVIVGANLRRMYPEEKAALLRMVFGVSAWAAIVVHILLTETYLFYTKGEEERLKKVSAIRRKALGL